VASLLAFVVCLLSCSSNTPEGVVIRFYKSLNAGEYSKARELYSAEALQFIDTQLPGDRFIQWADMETRKGTISDVKVTTADTRGEKSDISVTVTYKDGASVNRTVTLKQENGDWKLGLIR
jgi:hypothetical protein